MKKMIKRCAAAIGGVTAFLGLSNTYIFVKAFGRDTSPKKSNQNLPAQWKHAQAATQRQTARLEKQSYEELHIKSYDHLNLYGRLIPPAYYAQAKQGTADGVKQADIGSETADHDHPVIILGIHGYHSDGLGDFAIFAPFYQSHGCWLCLPDDRAHGKSDGNYIGFGYHDRFDCLAWCRYLVSRFGENCTIYLHGISMGAATVMSCCDDASLLPQVRGIISDCGYSSGWDQVAHVLKTKLHLPAFPMLNVYNIVCRALGGYDLKKIRPIDSVKNTKVPILFIHGDADNFVPTTMVYRLYHACRGVKKLLIIHGAGHALSYLTDTKAYEKAVLDFMDKCARRH